MSFNYFNSNPDDSEFKSGKKKIWCRDDSAFRAVSCALDISWESAYRKLCDIGIRLHDNPVSKNVVDTFCIGSNFVHETFGKPSKGCTRPIVADFIEEHPTGTYIVYLPHYYVCIKDGEIHNTEDVSNSSVYSYWKLLD